MRIHVIISTTSRRSLYLCYFAVSCINDYSYAARTAAGPGVANLCALSAACRKTPHAFRNDRKRVAVKFPQRMNATAGPPTAVCAPYKILYRIISLYDLVTIMTRMPPYCDTLPCVTQASYVPGRSQAETEGGSIVRRSVRRTSKHPWSPTFAGTGESSGHPLRRADLGHPAVGLPRISADLDETLHGFRSSAAFSASLRKVGARRAHRISRHWQRFSQSSYR